SGSCACAAAVEEPAEHIEEADAADDLELEEEHVLTGRWNRGDNHCEYGDAQASEAHDDATRFATRDDSRLWLGQETEKQINERNEVDQHVHVEHDLIDDLDRRSFAEECQGEDRGGGDRLDEDRHVRRAPLRVNAAERGREVLVETDDEGDAGGAREPGAGAADVADREDGGGPRGDPPEASGGRRLDRLQESRRDAQGLCGHEPQDADGAEDVEAGNAGRREVDRARKRAGGLVDLVTERGAELEAREGEGDRGP